MYYEQNYTVTEIKRIMNISRQTIYTYLKFCDFSEDIQKKSRNTKMAKYKDDIIGFLEEDKIHHHKQRHSGKRIFERLKEKYPDKVSVNNYFDTELAKKIYAGSDLFLMPSMFEPCGLSQMISLRYGTVPIVRTTGGLRDTIVGYVGNKEEGNGFTFWGNQVDDLVEMSKKALAVYNNKNEWKALVKKAMEEDFSWAHSAKEYAKLYE